MIQTTILIAGMMNTKGTEIKYLVDKVREAGAIPLVMDLTLGESVDYDWVDIRPATLLEHVHSTPEELRHLSRGKAGDLMQEAAVAEALELQASDRIDGVIGYAGGMGTAVITAMMRALKTGLPKIILSSVANAGFPTAHFFGTKDIYMANPIFEAGMNPVTRHILSNAAYAVVGMAVGNQAFEDNSDKLSIGYVMLGITTPCVLQAVEDMEEKSYESMIVHGVGATIENLIREGKVSALMDLTPNDIALNAVRPESSPERMTVAAQYGIPQIIAPGGLDLMVVTKASAPAWLKEEIEAGAEGRGLYPHVSDTYAVGTSMEECVRAGRCIARRIGSPKAPAIVCVPLRGLSGADCGKADLALGWGGPGACPVFVPDPENPCRSLRSRKFLEGFLQAADRSNPNIRVFLLDCHINAPAFAHFCAQALDAAIHGSNILLPDIASEVKLV